MLARYLTFFLLTSTLFATTSTVTLQERPFEITLRAKAETSKSTKITTPGNYIPIKTIVNDGDRVRKGEVICEFDITDTQYKLESQILRRKIIESDLAADLLALDNTENKDKLELLKDQKAVKIASLNRLKSLPLKEDILLAEGQLKVAQLKYEAVEKDFLKAKELFKKKLSSKTELFQAEQALKQEKVNISYSKEYLEYTKLPASSSSIEKIKLEIKNIDLEISKITKEIAENTTLVDIQKTKATNRLKVNDRTIDEYQNSINKVQIKAPIDGYVNYAKTYKPIAVGERFPQNYNLLEIPDLSTLSFKALLPERLRSFYQVDDLVDVYVNGQSNKAVKAKIAHIDRVAIDSEAAKEASWGDKNKTSGIKVYVIKITLLDRCHYVRPGMHAKVKLKSKKIIKGAAVQSSFIKQKEERFFASFDGTYQQVKGQVIGDLFFFADDKLNSQTLSLYGTFPTEKEAENSPLLKGFFKTSGELKPYKSTTVSIPDGGGWLSVKWLAPEDSIVKKGQHLATFESDDLKEDINAVEDELSTSRAQRKEINTKLDIQKRESAFQVASKKNLAEIAKIDHRIALNGIDYTKYLQDIQRVQSSEIELESLQDKLKRLEEIDPQFVTSKELQEVKRDIRKAKLNLEKAKIDLQLSKEGEDQLVKKKAEFDAFKTNSDYLIAKREAEFKIYKQEMELKKTELKEKRYQFDLDRYLRVKENLMLYAPTSGPLRYENAYVGGAISKIEVGSRVPDKARVMSIPDMSKVEVTVDVPEHLYSRVKKGMKVKVRIPSLSQKIMNATVVNIDYFFEAKEKKEAQIGLYSSHEPLGETIFKVKIQLDETPKKLKANMQVEAYFPFTDEGESHE